MKPGHVALRLERIFYSTNPETRGCISGKVSDQIWMGMADLYPKVALRWLIMDAMRAEFVSRGIGSHWPRAREGT